MSDKVESATEGLVITEDGLTLTMLADLVNRLSGEAVSVCGEFHIGSDKCDCSDPEEIRALPEALREKLRAYFNDGEQQHG